ncbi:type II toxin-antitoxin system RelE/ParE family toxin [Lentisphaera profundi]|uniref:Type II toxin-antitoxin system RelE/ParE family toxin n=1 Tax=Lentisphaera profundi TaxID=1658616 RepID=A0ABY7VNB8_9BACT|nr:type II toxin-antitoxin system RelE/ParE family toxin [Lentisphaera profundi]WDE95595.1 type II toxin-antitoxin system RelE/ParE family toxin [Lentisphaera profundi]
MSNYKIEFKKSALKEIEKINKTDAKKIMIRIGELASEPRPFNCIKLTNDDKYRVRVGDYRVLYEIIDELLVINVVKIKHRKEVYKQN